MPSYRADCPRCPFHRFATSSFLLVRLREHGSAGRIQQSATSAAGQQSCSNEQGVTPFFRNPPEDDVSKGGLDYIKKSPSCFFRSRMLLRICSSVRARSSGSAGSFSSGPGPDRTWCPGSPRFRNSTMNSTTHPTPYITEAAPPKGSASPTASQHSTTTKASTMNAANMAKFFNTFMAYPGI